MSSRAMFVGLLGASPSILLSVPSHSAAFGCPTEEQIPGSGSRWTTDIVLRLLEGGRIKPIPKLCINIVFFPVYALPGLWEQDFKVSSLSVIHHQGSGPSTKVKDLQAEVSAGHTWFVAFSRGDLAFPNLARGEEPAMGLCRTFLPSHHKSAGGFSTEQSDVAPCEQAFSSRNTCPGWARGAPPQAILQ